jgi:hypothetical protein
MQTIGAAGADSDGELDPETYADTFVWDYFPPRLRASYEPQFFAKILVSVVKVSHDLANPAAGQPACIAEEIITNAICKYAYALMDEAGLDYDADLEELLLDDADFGRHGAVRWRVRVRIGPSPGRWRALHFIDVLAAAVVAATWVIPRRTCW